MQGGVFLPQLEKVPIEVEQRLRILKLALNIHLLVVSGNGEPGLGSIWAESGIRSCILLHRCSGTISTQPLDTVTPRVAGGGLGNIYLCHSEFVAVVEKGCATERQ